MPAEIVSYARAAWSQELPTRKESSLGQRNKLPYHIGFALIQIEEQEGTINSPLSISIGEVEPEINSVVRVSKDS
jgi:hypothetical protein